MHFIHFIFLHQGITFVKYVDLSYCYAMDPYGFISPEIVFPDKVTYLLIL